MKIPSLIAFAAITAAGCTHTLRDSYQEPVLERVTDNSGSRPEWVRKTPPTDGRMYFVATHSDGLTVEYGVRVSKAYALAQVSEQLQAAVTVKSQLTNQRSSAQVQDQISWNSAAVLRSFRQDDIYWERRWTQEGVRYSVWTLWSIPEKAFYTIQEEVSK